MLRPTKTSQLSLATNKTDNKILFGALIKTSPSNKRRKTIKPSIQQEQCARQDIIGGAPIDFEFVIKIKKLIHKLDTMLKTMTTLSFISVPNTTLS